MTIPMPLLGDILIKYVPTNNTISGIIIPRACTRDKVIDCVCLSSVTTKITRYKDSGILVVSKYDHTIVGSGEKLSSSAHDLQCS